MHEFDASTFDTDRPYGAFKDVQEFNFGHHDIYEHMLGLMPGLVTLARQAIYLAESDRVAVGAAAVFTDRDDANPRVGIYAAQNIRFRVNEDDRDEYDVHDIDKVCAEVGVLLPAGDDHFTRAELLVVSATTDPEVIESIMGEYSETLPPCTSSCHQTFTQNPLVDRATTIVSIGDTEDIMQVRSFKQYDDWATKRYADEDGEVRPPRAQPYSMHDFPMKLKRYRAARRAAGITMRQKDDIKRQRLFREALKTF